jgi:hypothetical protein
VSLSVQFGARDGLRRSRVFGRKEAAMPAKAAKSKRKRPVYKDGDCVTCNVKPEAGPFTFPAGGGEFFILVTYPLPPDACPYTATSSVSWITTNPRISEFDVRLAPNRFRRMREGVVVVQGECNRLKHRVRIRQLGRT